MCEQKYTQHAMELKREYVNKYRVIGRFSGGRDI